MKQSKRMSAIESVTNIVFGMAVAFTSNILIFYITGAELPLHTNIGIVTATTGLSFARQFLLRRVFERYRA